MLVNINKLLSNFKGYYQGINCATLTGAMDVIVVEQPDGSLKSTPIHVRFGKVGVLRPSEVKVDMIVNDVSIPDLNMRLGPSGEAYFGIKANGESINICSFENGGNGEEVEVVSPDGKAIPVITSTVEEDSISITVQNSISNLFGFAQAASSITSVLNMRDDKTETKSPSDSTAFPQSTSSLLAENYGNVQLSSVHEVQQSYQQVIAETEPSSQYNAGTHIKQLPIFGDEIQEFTLSLCGGLDKKHEPSMERFLQHQVSFDNFGRDPIALLAHPDLVVRWNGHFYTWPAIGAAIVSALAFQAPLTEAHLNRLNVCSGSVKCNGAPPPKTTTDIPVARKTSTRSGFRDWLWGSKSKMAANMPSFLQDDSLPGLDVDGSFSDSEVNHSSPKRLQSLDGDASSPILQKATISTALSSSNICERQRLEDIKENLVTVAEKEKIIHLTSEQLKRLNLKPGANAVVFSISTRYQGTTQCSCYMYLWKWTDRLVISDVDGTITKSDVLGNIFGLVGPFWAQSGIAQLYNSINRNGYRVVYLTARAISQSAITRNYLRQLRQDGFGLPDGPILLSPSSLFQAFHREVIEKRPEVFKIQCLSQLQSLFPQGDQALYAGFGNRPNDVITYKALNIHLGRIFTVNYEGQLRHELPENPIVLTYSTLGSIVDEYFPPSSTNLQLHQSNSFKEVDETITIPSEQASTIIINNTTTLIEITAASAIHPSSE